MKLMLQWITALGGIGAAGFWIWSAVVTIPDFLQTRISGPGSITDIMQKQSWRSGIAALCAAVAALAQTAQTYCFPS